MKSTIKIDFDESRNPVIKIKQFDSDDLRDKMLKEFFRELGYTSSWLFVHFQDRYTDVDMKTQFTEIIIHPVAEGALEKMMLEVKDRIEDSKKDGPQSTPNGIKLS